MTTRLFTPHHIRRTLSLCRPWEYTFPGLDPAAGPYGELYRVTLDVPGAWESHPGLTQYRGVAHARLSFEVDQAGPARLVFEGVSHTAEVFLDGVSIGSHYNAYTAFACEVPWLAAGAHELTVRISNEFGAASALHVPNDYYSYGGITRPVELQLLPRGTHIAAAHFVTRRHAGRWWAECTVRLRALGDSPRPDAVVVELAGARAEVTVGAFAQETTLTCRFPCDDVTPWSPAAPTLFYARVTLRCGGAEIDDLVERVGFRTIETAGPLLLLNGEPIFLRGFNRHEDHPDFGCALPVSLMRRDLQQMRNLGANAVRTSHYPNDPRFLDLCDELGVLVWEENHARGLFAGGAAPMDHPLFRPQCEQVNREMVEQHFNHPSIIIWGILNECESFSAYGRSCYAEQFAQIRALDSSRPTTFATCHHGRTDARRERCLDLPDICSFNVYYNWYGDTDPAEGLARTLRFHEAELTDRPLIISEFGAGAVPGYRDATRSIKGSEDGQVRLLDACLHAFLAHPRVTGVFIWQFCDVRVDESWALSRPRGLNDKGVFDEYRRPKLAAEVVRARFTAHAAAAG
jgi:beta-glucuronidase